MSICYAPETLNVNYNWKKYFFLKKAMIPFRERDINVIISEILMLLEDNNSSKFVVSQKINIYI